MLLIKSNKIINNLAHKVAYRDYITIINKQNKYHILLILPDSLFSKVYNVFLLIIVLYSVLVNFYITSFNVQNNIGIIDNIADIFFIIDIFKNFLSAYNDYDNNLISDFKAIAMHYVFGWFILDFTSSIPFSFIEGTSSSLKLTKLAKFPRILKFFKMFKFLRIIKLLKNKKKFDSIFSNLLFLSNGIERLVTSLIIIITVHLFSCIWYMNYSEGNNFGFKNNFDLYLMSWYWSIQTIFTVGYGDYGSSTAFQYFIGILVMFFGVFIYGFIISSVNQINLMINKKEAELETQLATLLRINKQVDINKPLMKKIQKFLESNFNFELVYTKLTEDVSEKIRK